MGRDGKKQCFNGSDGKKQCFMRLMLYKSWFILDKLNLIYKKNTRLRIKVCVNSQPTY